MAHTPDSSIAAALADSSTPDAHLPAIHNNNNNDDKINDKINEIPANTDPSSSSSSSSSFSSSASSSSPLDSSTSSLPADSPSSSSLCLWASKVFTLSADPVHQDPCQVPRVHRRQVEALLEKRDSTVNAAKKCSNTHVDLVHSLHLLKSSQHSVQRSNQDCRLFLADCNEKRATLPSQHSLLTTLNNYCSFLSTNRMASLVSPFIPDISLFFKPILLLSTATPPATPSTTNDAAAATATATAVDDHASKLVEKDQQDVMENKKNDRLAQITGLDAAELVFSFSASPATQEFMLELQTSLSAIDLYSLYPNMSMPSSMTSAILLAVDVPILPAAPFEKLSHNLSLLEEHVAKCTNQNNAIEAEMAAFQDSSFSFHQEQEECAQRFSECKLAFSNEFDNLSTLADQYTACRNDALETANSLPLWILIAAVFAFVCKWSIGKFAAGRKNNSAKELFNKDSAPVADTTITEKVPELVVPEQDSQQTILPNDPAMVESVSELASIPLEEINVSTPSSKLKSRHRKRSKPIQSNPEKQSEPESQIEDISDNQSTISMDTLVAAEEFVNDMDDEDQVPLEYSKSVSM